MVWKSPDCETIGFVQTTFTNHDPDCGTTNWACPFASDRIVRNGFESNSRFVSFTSAPGSGRPSKRI